MIARLDGWLVGWLGRGMDGSWIRVRLLNERMDGGLVGYVDVDVDVDRWFVGWWDRLMLSWWGG